MISCVDVAVVVSLCGDIRGENVFLTSLKGIVKFWGKTRLKKGQPHIMVTLQGRLKGETGENWHMVPLVDETNSGIEVRIWVGIWMEVIVGADERIEGWVF